MCHISNTQTFIKDQQCHEEQKSDWHGTELLDIGELAFGYEGVASLGDMTPLSEGYTPI